MPDDAIVSRPLHDHCIGPKGVGRSEKHSLKGQRVASEAAELFAGKLIPLQLPPITSSLHVVRVKPQLLRHYVAVNHKLSGPLDEALPEDGVFPEPGYCVRETFF